MKPIYQYIFLYSILMFLSSCDSFFSLHPYHKKHFYTQCHDFNDKIKSCSYEKKITFVTLSNNTEIILSVFDNPNNPSAVMNLFMQPGDTLTKQKCGDSIFIKRNGRIYAWQNDIDEGECEECE